MKKMNRFIIITFVMIISQLLLNSCGKKMQNDLPEWAIGPFERYKRNPILKPTGNGFESNHVYNPGVIISDQKIPAYPELPDTQFFMFYRAEDSQDRSSIGLALSDDGYHFRRYENNPILNPAEEYELPGGCEDARIVKYNEKYYMYYTGFHPGTGDHISLCLAVSDDLLNWEKKGPIFDQMMKNGAVVTNPNNEAVKINGKFIMYSSIGGEPYISYSEDLVNWDAKKLEDIQITDEYKPWEFCIAKTDYKTPNDKILLFLGGTMGPMMKKEKEWHYAISEAVFSREDPEKMIGILDRPVIIPTKEYEKTGKIQNTVFMNTLVKYHGQWWMYYGGADHVTCLAKSAIR